MAIYAIGDVQGCYDTLRCLLDTLAFDATHDTLWFTGDLVNRGGQSLQTLEYIYSIRNSVVTVLGNHDLHLIAAFRGYKILDQRSDLLEIVNSPQSAKLIDWLQQQPLLYHEHKHVLVHAGIAPMWSLKQAKAYAREVEDVLRSSSADIFLNEMYGDKPTIWSEDLTGIKRLRCITNYLTRMRFVDKNGALDLTETGHPDSVAKNLTPWFSIKDRPAEKKRIIFGHWASLMGQVKNPKLIALDTGCVWGGRLSAYHLETGKIISCKC